MSQVIYKSADGKYLDYAWPGGYPVYHICADGGVLCPACANDPTNEASETACSSDWRIIGSDINWEDPNLSCDHCEDRIPSAYAEDEAAALIYFNRALAQDFLKKSS